jgi:hypothetical protein
MQTTIRVRDRKYGYLFGLDNPALLGDRAELPTGNRALNRSASPGTT